MAKINTHLRLNQAYTEVINKIITAHCHYLDVGAGIGLLSLMVARAMGFGASMQKEKAYTFSTTCHGMLVVENLSAIPYQATTDGQIFVSSFHIQPQLVESSFLWRLPDCHNNEAN
ncbi:hypothetical protein F8388_018421 [Cannabis sativa]|uniref:Uncharacterized protein n=1 Tax=Cannabis sativa TaxID=3483 RepID=A0A7J6DWS6_CANSA|nr:hypothetical protein F8388_018421 [Cannabis sativa]